MKIKAAIECQECKKEVEIILDGFVEARHAYECGCCGGENYFLINQVIIPEGWFYQDRYAICPEHNPVNKQVEGPDREIQTYKVQK